MKNLNDIDKEDIVTEEDEGFVYVINISVMNLDGAVEMDTIFSKNLFTEEDAQKCSDQLGCSVLASNIGKINYFDVDFINDNTFEVLLQRDKDRFKEDVSVVNDVNMSDISLTDDDFIIDMEEI